jgi:hypothetical protein
MIKAEGEFRAAPGFLLNRPTPMTHWLVAHHHTHVEGGGLP